MQILRALDPSQIDSPRSGRANAGHGQADPSIEVRKIVSFDGTELACYVAGQANHPTVVLCSGLGGNLVVWRRLIGRLAENYRVVYWDYRGLYSSGPAPRADAYEFGDHVRDLIAVVECLGNGPVIGVGWSMGVHLLLELHRRDPKLLCAAVAIHGTAGRPIANAFDSRVPERISPLLFTLMRWVGPRLAELGPRLSRSDAFMTLFMGALRGTGCASQDIDDELFAELAGAWTQLDLGIYAQIFETLRDNDASDCVPHMTVPTLVVAGSADRFTPEHLSRALVERLPNAELVVIPGATHFGLIEYPDTIADEIERFLATCCDAGAAAASA